MIRSLLCAAVLVLASALPAAAQLNILGIYTGTILDGGAEVPVETSFSQKGDVLAGKYVIDGTQGRYTGRISDVDLADTGAYTMVWTDQYGQGTATLTFAPDGSSFRGKWYIDGHVGGSWNGTKAP